MKKFEDNDTVSIIVPVYKVPEKYLRKCIESCIYQTYKRLDIVIVHDRSDDNCGNICEEYAQKYHNINLIHKTGKVNGGLSAARNDGVNAAKGKWITFLDGDDWIEPNAISSMVAIANKDKATQIVISKICKDYEGNVHLYNYRYKDGQKFDKKGCQYLKQEVLNFKANISGVYAKLISKDYLIRNNIFHNNNLKNGVEGLEFNIRLFDKADNAVFIDKVSYHYMYNDQSLSVNVNESTNLNIINGFKIIKSYIKNTSDYFDMLNRLNNRILYFIVTTAMRCYFSPQNTLAYSERVRMCNKFLQENIIREAMKGKNYRGLSISRKITLFLIKYRLYIFVQLIASIRYRQLQAKKGNKT